MQQVIDLIPFVDLGIALIVGFFIYTGWKQGTPRLLLIVGALYSGFLLASVYYHFFATLIGNTFKARANFTLDLVAFIALFAAVSGLMTFLLSNLFGHLQVRGRAMVFGKLFGAFLGLLAGAFIVAVVTMLLRAPVIANETRANDAVNSPVVIAFGNGYARSMLAPNVMKAAPIVLKAFVPALPAAVKDKGAVPLLQSVAQTNTASTTKATPVPAPASTPTK